MEMLGRYVGNMEKHEIKVMSFLCCIASLFVMFCLQSLLFSFWKPNKTLKGLILLFIFIPLGFVLAFALFYFIFIAALNWKNEANQNRPAKREP